MVSDNWLRCWAGMHSDCACAISGLGAGDCEGMRSWRLSAGVQPDWDGGMAHNGVPAAAYLAYRVYSPDGTGICIAYNPYEGPVPATLPGAPAG